MKILDLLPKRMAIELQHHHLNRIESELAYHKAMARVLEDVLEEGFVELERLKMK